MSRHEHFEELAAISAKGELTPPEERELAEHLVVCPECREVFDDYQQLHAPLNFVTDPSLEAVLEARREKVHAGVLEAIRKSPRPAQPFELTPAGSTRNSHSSRFAWSALAACAVVVLSFWLGTRYEQHVANASSRLANRTTANFATAPKVLPPAQPSPDPENVKLAKDLRVEKAHEAELDRDLSEKEQELSESEGARAALVTQIDADSKDLATTKALLAAKTDELTQMDAEKQSDSNSITVLSYQVNDLKQRLDEQTQSLDRERQLLSSGRDIRDIIGARNLHIIDVYDTDSSGNTGKSFARAFYTEGKSLIFYAYDLPSRNVEDGKYVYAAWGEKNGNKSHTQKLGILLNDDKNQRRWALSFSDPNVLKEIDSVFVTLERVGSDDEGPKGKRMLTAYLDSQVNHP